MNLVVANNQLGPEDLESKLREELNRGFPINWKLFQQILHWGGCNHSSYQKIVDLLLHLNILSLELDGNIVLRDPDVTTRGGTGNPRHYKFKNVDCGNDVLYFTRDQDAIDYIKTGEELKHIVKGLQAQRVYVIK